MTPQSYTLYGSVVSSTLSLSLPLAEGDVFDYRLDTTDCNAQNCHHVDWHTHAALADGTPWLSLGTSPNGYWLEFHDHACFHVTPDRRTITVYPDPNTTPNTIEHLFLDQVMPRVLSLGEKLVLHGAVVAGADAVIALVGESGRGKSTLAAHFWQAGYEVLSDDCVVLNQTGTGYAVIPSYPGVRLWPDTASSLLRVQDTALPRVSDYNRKVRWAASTRRTESLPSAMLKAVILLDPPAVQPDIPIRLTHVTGHEIMLTLLGNTFRLEGAQAVIADEFERLGDFIDTLDFYRLSYPRAYDQLPHVLQTIQTTLGFI